MIQITIQAVGLSMLSLAVGLFRSKKYKKEFTLFGLSGLTIVIVGSMVPV